MNRTSPGAQISSHIANPASQIGVGIIGLGFMGRVHITSYAGANQAGFANRLVAVADASPARLTGRADSSGNLESSQSEQVFDPATVHTYSDPAALLRDPQVELVSICTPTDTHAPLAIAALEAGKHVLIEKPVATTVEEVQRVAAAAKAANRLAMPAMCMRFWPGWTWLKDRIDDQAFGRLTGITFTRMGAPPSWSPDFYLNQGRSGGALFDLHIHDADFILHCFGPPQSVVSQGTTNHLTTIYRYGPSGPQRVVAEGGWGAHPGFPYRMRYTALFERATADWELGREPTLMVARDGKSEVIPLPPISAYEAQVRHMLEAVASLHAGKSFTLRAQIEDAQAVTRLLRAEARSLTSGAPESIR